MNASRYVSFSRGTPAERQGTGVRPPSLCNRIGICSLFPGASTGSPTRSLQSLRQDVEFQIELSILLGESPFLSQIALCCLISVCHAEEVTQALE